MQMSRPTPHGQILKALTKNTKLPDGDQKQVEATLERYSQWKKTLHELKEAGTALLKAMVDATNEYKKFVEFDLIFQSEQDFLYRQAGQLKLNNTILEEFMPHLVDTRLVPGIQNIKSLTVGPQPCYAGMYIGPIHAPIGDGAIYIKTKNQDFTVGRRFVSQGL